MLTRLLCGSLLLACAAFAQLDGISVSGVRFVPLPAADASINFAVLAGLGLSLDDVIAKVPDIGLTRNHLIAISSTGPIGPPPSGSRLAYQFRVTVPFEQLKDITDKLERIRRSELDVDIQLTYVSIGASDAAVEAARQRAIPDLIAELRRRAEALAAAANLRAGRILSINENVVTPPAGAQGPLQMTLNMNARFATE
jgi:hypothetical protein